METIRRYSEIFQLVLALSLIGDIVFRLFSKPSEIMISELKDRVTNNELVAKDALKLKVKSDEDSKRIDKLELRCNNLEKEISIQLEKFYQLILAESKKTR